MRSKQLSFGTMSFDEYLAFEEASPVRHEYVYGEVFAMTGGTTCHNDIILNIAGRLRAVGRRQRCRVFAQGVKFRASTTISYYPDILVACGAAGNVESTVEAPCFVAEVTSPSTARIDRREKLEVYQRVPSLQAYLLVEQRRRFAIMYTRSATGWDRRELTESDTVEIPCPLTTLSLDDIYEDIVLPPLRVSEAAYAADEAREAEREIELEAAGLPYVR